VSTEAAQAPAASIPPTTQVSTTADAGTWRRDPFIGSFRKSTVAPSVKTISQKNATEFQLQDQDIQLQGIMLTDKTFHALINGRSVKAGDRIAGVTITHISRYQVVVINERKEKVIYDIYQGRIDRGKK
jgi:hypothetical protein